jgi:predicted DNA-binding transcriptional regulator AlpA
MNDYKPDQKTPERLLRLKNILAPDGPIPVSKSTWWKRVREHGPKPIKLGPRTTAWSEKSVLELVERLSRGEGW